jgi:hypothetical protein
MNIYLKYRRRVGLYPKEPESKPTELFLDIRHRTFTEFR